jgi:hypothetical protein
MGEIGRHRGRMGQQGNPLPLEFLPQYGFLQQTVDSEFCGKFHGEF